MIDLHIHTKYSDGIDSIEEILKKAEAANLKIISITDHNTVDFYKEVKNVKVDDIYSGRIINGSEIACLYNEKIKEVLIYNFNIDDFKKLGIKNINEIENQKIEYMFDNLDKLNIKHSSLEDIKFTINAIRTVYSDILLFKENKEILNKLKIFELDDFKFRYIYVKGSPLYLDFSKIYPSFLEVCTRAKKIGAIIFIAHPLKGPNKEQLYKELLDMLQFNIVDGVECYNKSHSAKDSNLLIKLCEEKHLFKSGGSDYHGNDSEVRLGSLSMNKSLVTDWLK